MIELIRYNDILLLMVSFNKTKNKQQIHLLRFFLGSLIFLVTISSCTSVAKQGISNIRSVTIEIPDLPDSLNGYRIVFVADIHFENRFSSQRFETLIRTINEQCTDCIILGGDHTLGTAQIAPFAQHVAALTAPDGVYAVIGNHDFYNGRAESIRTLRTVGIVVLDETLVVTPRGLVIAGINDLRDVYPVMSRFNDILDPAAITVLASHNPDFAEDGDLSRFDLVLSGHTHGGQITFFGYAPIIPSLYGQKYRTGTVYSQNTPVIISNGAGYSGNKPFRFRLFAPSDFLLVTLRPRIPALDREQENTAKEPLPREVDR